MGNIGLKNNLIGIYEKAIPNHFNFEEKIIAAKKAGYDYLEISIDESDERLARLTWSREDILNIKSLLDRHQFHILSMCLSGHRRFPFGSADPEIRKHAHDMIEHAFELAHQLNIRNIQVAGYDVYYEKSTKESKKYFMMGLMKTAYLAERYQIMASVEVMDTYFMGTIKRISNYTEVINSPYLKIYPDLGNLSRWTDNPSKEIQTFRHDIVAIHLKDTQPNIFKNVSFGSGTVDFKTIFKTLNNLSYKGPMLVEMWADNTQTEDMEGCIKRIKDAKRWLNDRM